MDIRFMKRKGVNSRIDLDSIRMLAKNFLQASVTDDYAEELSASDWFVRSVRDDVECASAWQDEGCFGFSDVKYALGRVILDAVIKASGEGRDSC